MAIERLKLVDVTLEIALLGRVNRWSRDAIRYYNGLKSKYFLEDYSTKAIDRLEIAAPRIAPAITSLG